MLFQIHSMMFDFQRLPPEKAEGDCAVGLGRQPHLVVRGNYLALDDFRIKRTGGDDGAELANLLKQVGC